ncbi:MAG: 3-phosphoshikimate 1-carboxyvinyltransferase [Chloroflexi bacterium]|nr:3-phosphoshikimate 1-carboxyvinyltransferase [Chloroflexota bacterium]
MPAALERPTAGAGPQPRSPKVATIRPAARLRGDLSVPGDKSISHRALMLALLAEGECRIDGCSGGADVRSTAGIVAALGANVELVADDGRNLTFRVLSPGADGLRQPTATLDCGNSGTSLRLFAGILAGLPLRAVLDGDDSLRGRPVARIIEPLRSMGAELSARQDDSLPPVTVVGRTPLRPVEWTTAVPSAQVKSAILLAGLRADGTTRIHEAVATRDHTERMLRARGVRVVSEPRDGGGSSVSIEGGAAVQAIDERVPGDLSSAAFWLVAAAIHPDAEVTIRGAGVNPTRRALLDILASMGALVEEAAFDEATFDDATFDEAAFDEAGEPRADLVGRTSELRAVDVGPADVAAAIDELPILCLAATQARGRTLIRGAGELRHKESDRIAGIVDGLSALGARIGADGDNIAIDGPTPLHGADVDSRGDHRLAMTFAIAGLIADGPTRIHDAASAAVSYPGFLGDLERIRS